MKRTVLLGPFVGCVVAALAAIAHGQPPAAEPATYQLNCEVTETGTDGHSKFVAKPTLIVREGASATLQCGPVMEWPKGSKCMTGLGLSITARLRQAGAGEVQAEVRVERNDLEKHARDAVRICGQHIQAIEFIKLGKPWKLAIKNGTSKAHTTFVLTIVAVDGAAQAPPPALLPMPAPVAQSANFPPVAVPAGIVAPPGIELTSYPPAPVGYATPAACAPPVPAVAVPPTSTGIQAEWVEGHPGLVRITAMIQSKDRRGEPRPPVPYTTYVRVPSSLKQLEQQTKKNVAVDKAAASQQQLDKILDRLTALEKRLDDGPTAGWNSPGWLRSPAAGWQSVPATPASQLWPSTR